MSNTQNTIWLEDAQDNFDGAVAEENWAQAHAVIADVRSKGFETEAQILTKSLFNAQKEMLDNEVTFEPYEHPAPPFIRPEEDDAPAPAREESEYETVASVDKYGVGSQVVIKKQYDY